MMDVLSLSRMLDGATGGGGGGGAPGGIRLNLLLRPPSFSWYSGEKFGEYFAGRFPPEELRESEDDEDVVKLS
jgi:hypothetical protein